MTSVGSVGHNVAALATLIATAGAGRAEDINDGAQHVPGAGKLGGQLRTSEQAAGALHDLRRARAEAEVRCF